MEVAPDAILSSLPKQPRRRRAPIVAAILFLWGLGALFLWFGRDFQLDRARQNVRAENVPQAVRSYQQYLRDHPADWAVHLEFGTFLKSHDVDAAMEVLQRIPDSAPEFLGAARHIAQIALIGNQDTTAEEALKSLFAADPDDFTTVLSLAELYHKQQRDDEALPLVRKCIELKPNRAQSYLLLSHVYVGVGRVSEMATPLHKALEIDPENEEAHVNLAFSYLWQGDFENARREAEWGRQHLPRNVHVWRLLGQIERDAGNPEEALRYVRQGLQIDPQELQCRVLEGQILIFQKRFQEAYDRVMPVYRRHPRDARVVGILAQAAGALGRRDDAARFQNLLVKLGNENYTSFKKAGM